MLLTEKETTRKELRKQKIPIDKQGEKKFNHFKLKYSLTVIGYFILLGVLTLIFGWDTMEPITYFLGSLGIILCVLYPIICGENINLLVFFQNKEIEFKNKA